jgi:hypothetical protein
MIPQFALQQASGTRKNEIRGRGRHDDQVQIGSLKTCGSQRPTARLQAQIAGRLAVVRKMTVPYAGATGDPVIVGFDATAHEIVVADGGAGQKTAGSGNAGEHARRSPEAVVAAQCVR